MDQEIYAKTYYENEKFIGESLEEHVGHLLNNFDVLKKMYSKEISRLIDDSETFWNNLKICVLFHDCGKISSHFQNKIRLKIQEKPFKIKSDLPSEIPHNYLSPAFLPENINNLEIIYTIALHHHRDIDFDDMYLNKIIREDLILRKESLNWLNKHGFTLREKLLDGYFAYLMAGRHYQHQYQKIRRLKSYILMKGLFHRIDHSASAHLPIELKRISNPRDKLLTYLKNKSEEKGFIYQGLKDFQVEAESHQDKNILLTASTGVGKTEFAINWIGGDKAFYTLPLKVSVNAMYKRFSDIFSEENIALLHSDCSLYGIDDKVADKDFKIEEHVFDTQSARQFSLPITITTADQLFTAVFKWPGYEKIYATLMYSKVILDEPQSYSPETLAMIIKALEEISQYGGRFCFMSATIHPFVRQYLNKVSVEIGPVCNKENKHRIQLMDQTIKEMIDQIEDQIKLGKKVLVICNTVRMAQNIYNTINIPSKKLLHSGFIKKHRAIKESEIQEDYESSSAVVWVTTQIVEASLDIDYDILFTEIATIDALLQRMGRIYRRSGRKINDNDPPNIIIACKEPSDNFFIYDKDVVSITLDVLKKYDDQILSENEKLLLMDKVFEDKEKVKIFYLKFKNSYSLLENGFETDNKSEANKLFREISNLTIIPNSIYIEYQTEIDQSIEILSNKGYSYKDRLLAIKKIDDYTLSLPYYKVSHPIKLIPKRGVYSADIDYHPDLGIQFSRKLKEYENFI